MTESTLTLSFLAAAERVLEAAGAPLTSQAITERALARRLVTTAGRTPEATMAAQLATSIKARGDASPFVRTAPNTFGLRRWIAEGKVAAPVEPAAGNDVRIVFFPDYTSLRVVLPVLHGMSRAVVSGLRAAMWEHTGTVDDNVDWTDPDRWIPERLQGEYRDAALRIWTGTRRAVTPRHMAGHWLLASGYGLLTDAPGGALVVTARGRDFLDDADGTAVREIDEHEGVLKLLSIVAEHGPGATGELLAPWMDFVRRASRIRAESTGRSFLYYRLRNLAERGLVQRSGIRYEITPAGLAYLKGSGLAEAETPAPEQRRDLWDLITAQRTAVRDALREHLAGIDPYAFEHVVRRLLEEMGYVDVQVTAPSGDKGVDVVARITLGITEIREVVQVKRHRANVGRPVLDMLRGSLHRFGAVRGTIITLGGFARGTKEAAFEPGVAPITLIDGDKLVDLLIQHRVGVRTRPVELLELDTDALTVTTEAEPA